ncbi:hypothetical protein SAMN02990966_01623 [Rhodospirillales bacterium URHD0017]|nr:hypothetical protein SAMN02990966_01623 [Rhodospirillales bacterium URHD0017]
MVLSSANSFLSQSPRNRAIRVGSALRAGGPTPRSPNGRPVHAKPDLPARKRGKMAGVGPTPCTADWLRSRGDLSFPCSVWGFLVAGHEKNPSAPTRRARKTNQSRRGKLLGGPVLRHDDFDPAVLRSRRKDGPFGEVAVVAGTSRNKALAEYSECCRMGSATIHLCHHSRRPPEGKPAGEDVRPIPHPRHALIARAGPVGRRRRFAKVTSFQAFCSAPALPLARPVGHAWPHRARNASGGLRL